MPRRERSTLFEDVAYPVDTGVPHRVIALRFPALPRAAEALQGPMAADLLGPAAAQAVGYGGFSYVHL